MAFLFKRKDRDEIYYIERSVNGQIVRESTGTHVLQIAKQKLLDAQTAEIRGEDLFKPTKTPIADVLTKYVAYIRTRKTDKSVQTEVYYLREAFGPIADAVTITSRKVSKDGSPAESKSIARRARRTAAIQADCFEHITTSQVADFISGKKAENKLSAKTANHYRQILIRLFNWAIKQGGVQIPGDRNPASRIERYKEDAPEIKFLSLAQIEEHLTALEDDVQMQAMVATLIYAGLRREEMLWLIPDDIDLGSGPLGAIRIRRKTVGEETWQPKTRKNRIIPISSRLRLYIDKWLLKRDKNQWFFSSPKGKRWEPDNFSADLRALNTAKEQGWKNKSGKLVLPFGCLVYRHTFGSQLAINGESLFKVAKLMGNSPAIAERHYAALSTESLTESVEFSRNPTPESSSTKTASA